MIGKLKGKVENIYEDHLLLDVGGICYIVYCSIKLLQNTQSGIETSFFIHMSQKDDIPILYGFADFQEKELFLLLTSVQGVGGKMGLCLIGEIDYKNLCSAIRNENSKILQQVPGIGVKIALRVINELKSNKRFMTGQRIEVSNEYQVKQDAISALVNLGFRRVDVISVVEQFIKEHPDNRDLELIIKSSISSLR